MGSSIEYSKKIKSLAKVIGFDWVGIAKARRLDEEAKKLETWLNHGYHGKMTYMENHFDKRIDPTALVPGAKSVISLLYNYYSEDKQLDPDAPKIASYAYGEDYHRVIKHKLKELLRDIQREIGAVEGRCFVDSAPVMEREWAKFAGLGWTGKNTLLINPQAGSYFFLAELIIDLELEPDQEIRDHCGTCTRCIEACPTGAISPQGYLLDGSKCISYLTIELKEEIPVEFSGKMENWMFGCDICQQVCPWNRFAKKHQEPAFEPSSELLAFKKKDWIDMTESTFNAVFDKSAVKRTRYKGLKRNIDFLFQKE